MSRGTGGLAERGAGRGKVAKVAKVATFSLIPPGRHPCHNPLARYDSRRTGTFGDAQLSVTVRSPPQTSHPAPASPLDVEVPFARIPVVPGDGRVVRVGDRPGRPDRRDD